MDPNANLIEQLELAKKVLDSEGEVDDMDRFAELVVAMDEWLSGGGSLPERWARGNG